MELIEHVLRHGTKLQKIAVLSAAVEALTASGRDLFRFEDEEVEVQEGRENELFQNVEAVHRLNNHIRALTYKEYNDGADVELSWKILKHAEGYAKWLIEMHCRREDFVAEQASSASTPGSFD